MRSRTMIFVCALVVTAASFASFAVVAQDCAGITSCVLIQFEAKDPSEQKGEAPTVNNPKLEVPRDARQQIGTVTFVMDGPPGASIVEFQCKDKQSNCSDLLTPFVDGGNHALGSFIVGNQGKRVLKIAPNLPGCDDAGCDPGDRSCVEDHCTYSYSVRDLNGEYKVLDPDVIVDPM